MNTLGAIRHRFQRRKAPKTGWRLRRRSSALARLGAFFFGRKLLLGIDLWGVTVLLFMTGAKSAVVRQLVM